MKSFIGGRRGLAIATLAVAAILVALTVAVLQSQQRARTEAIGRLDVRARVSAQLLAGTIALSSQQVQDLAPRLLADAKPTEPTIRRWEQESRSTAVATALLDSNGQVLASRPRSVSLPDRSTIGIVRDGRPTSTGIMRQGSTPVVWLLVPIKSNTIGPRILATAYPASTIRPFVATTFAGAAGAQDSGGILLLDSRGKIVSAVGPLGKSPIVAKALEDAVKRNTRSGSVRGSHFAIDPVAGSGWNMALVAPERALTADLPSTLWPRLVLLLLAMSLGAVVVLSERAIAASRRANDARAEAMHASEMKSRFLSHISHELKQPLAAIMGFSDILTDRADLPEPDRLHYIGIISRSGRTLEHLVNELLDISRIEAGRVLLNIEAADLRSAIDEALALNEPIAAQSKVTLTLRYLCPEDLRIAADPFRLRQVLINLISNAVKYNRDGGTVTVAAAETPNGTIRVDVTDDGIGIAADQLPKLFQPFERLATQKKHITGSGLGLVITKGLVEAMHGTVTVKSVVDVGSTFTFELPVARVPGDQQSAPRAKPMIDEPGRSMTGRVLYVDDDPASLELVGLMLSRNRERIDYETAHNGRAGLQQLKTHPPDLMLLDLNLPDLSGEQVLRQLRSNSDTADIPVIIISSDTTSLTVTRLLHTGADAYLTKPLDIQRFLETIDVLLTREHRMQGTSSSQPDHTAST